MVSGDCGWFKVVLGGFGWFAVLVVMEKRPLLLKRGTRSNEK